GVGSGTTGQTLRHDGDGWVANSILTNDGTNVGIGITNPSSPLHINSSTGTPQYLSDTVNVAHGMTTLVPTSVYGTLGKWSSGEGGLFIGGYSEGSAGGILLRGIAGTGLTTRGAIELRAGKQSTT